MKAVEAMTKLIILASPIEAPAPTNQKAAPREVQAPDKAPLGWGDEEALSRCAVLPKQQMAVVLKPTRPPRGRKGSMVASLSSVGLSEGQR
jgi:hypothetical protein